MNFGKSGDEKYRWNHCGVDVESLPAYKYFVFGGSTGIADESKPRERGTQLNDLIYMDLAPDKEEVAPVKLDKTEILPDPREDSTIIYNKTLKSIVIFGGFSNEWFSDIYSLNISKIVGPTYSVKCLEPNVGRISGGEQLKLHGSKLPNSGLLVYFYYIKDKEKMEEKHIA